MAEDGPLQRADHGVLPPASASPTGCARWAIRPTIRWTCSLTTRLSDPPIAVLKYPSVAERRKQIAESPNGDWLLEPYQLVSQNKLEPLLKEVAEATPNVTVRYGCELVDFAQDADGVTVTARTVDGNEETLRCAYLAGCDGGTSTVRKKLGIKLEGRGSIRQLVQVIFRSDDLYERIVTGKGRHYQFADAAGSSMVAQGTRKEFTLHSSLPPDTDFRPVIQDLIGFPCDFEIRHVIPWRHHLLMADHYRDGRVFLAGDAVHLVIPTGGLGMNTGVGDAFDLSWKLAGTINGWGGPACSMAMSRSAGRSACATSPRRDGPRRACRSGARW